MQVLENCLESLSSKTASGITAMQCKSKVNALSVTVQTLEAEIARTPRSWRDRCEVIDLLGYVKG